MSPLSKFAFESKFDDGSFGEEDRKDDLQQVAERYGMRLAGDLKQYPFVQKGVSHIPYALSRKKKILPLDLTDGQLLVAIADPLDLEGLEEVRCISGLSVCEMLAHLKDIEEAIELCYHQKEDAASNLIANLVKSTAQEEIREESDGYDLLAQEADAAVIRLLNALLLEAIQQGASDVHFEPMEEGVNIRYRIDGVLQTRHAPSKEYQSQIITRIKVMARLDIAEQRLPQDGRIKLKIAGRQIDFRVSSIPVAHGERIVLRILDKSNVQVGLSTIGMRQETVDLFRKMIRYSEGIVLVTGPTGSGKTTTLYSALSDIHSQETNIMTIEDPVEYKLQGMAQIGVNPKIGLHFSTGLRHILRQDPDVIMIGEIRDKETAEIAIQAALTGHLVLSTLHTNDAPSAMTRLVDMGVEPYLLSSSIIAVLAQRLVRKLCPHCKESYVPSEDELKELYLQEDQESGYSLFRPRGCHLCFGTGYKGRHGIYELMPVTHAMKRQLLKSADSLELARVAMQEGLSSLRREGGWLVKSGITSTAEVFRVSRSCEGD